MRLARASAAVRVLGGLGLVAPLVGVGRHDQRLAGVAVDLLQLAELSVQAHLGLGAVGDDARRLLPKAPVLVLRIADRLLELDLGVGALFERAGSSSP